MIGRAIGWVVSSLRDAVARALVRAGVTPNMLTGFGAAATVGAGVCFALALKTNNMDWCILAAVLLYISFCSDMLDGAVARFSGQATKFGAFLDSCMDRAGDFAIWAGLAMGFAWQSPANLTFVALSMLGFFEAVMISYIKARSEDFIFSCQVGYWQRPERCSAVIIAAFACNPAALVVEQSILPIFTMFRRAGHTWAILAGRRPVTNARLDGKWYHKIQPWLYPRASWPYDIMTAAYIAFLIFARFDPAEWDILRDWLG